MADTIRGNFLNTACSDCGKQGPTFKHWGLLVPVRQCGYFCDGCMSARNEDWKAGRSPRPLGQPYLRSGVYRHFKGNIYHVLGVAENTETRALVAVYIPQYGEHKGKLSCRDLKMFLEDVDRPELNYSGPRFVLVEEKKFI